MEYGNDGNGAAKGGTKRNRLAVIVVAGVAVAAAAFWIWSRLGLPVSDEALVRSLPPYSQGVLLADVEMLRNSAAGEFLERLQKIAEAERNDSVPGYGLVTEAVERIAAAAWSQPAHAEGTEWRVVLEGGDDVMTGTRDRETESGRGWTLDEGTDADRTVVAVRDGHRTVGIAPLSVWDGLHPVPDPPEADLTGTGPGPWLMRVWKSLPRKAWLRSAFLFDTMQGMGDEAQGFIESIAGNEIAGGAVWSVVAEGTAGTMELVLMLEGQADASDQDMSGARATVQMLAGLYALAAFQEGGRTPGSGMPGSVEVWSPPDWYEGPPRTGLVWTVSLAEAYEMLGEEDPA